MRFRIASAVSLAVTLSLAAGCGSGSSADASGPSSNGDGGTGGQGSGPMATCRAKGDLPFVWVREYATNTSFLDATSILVAPDGALFLYGTYKAQPVFGAGQPNEATLDASLVNSDDLWFAKLDGEATFQWAKRAGGTNDDKIAAAAVAADGSVVLAGPLQGETMFGKGEAKETVVASKGPGDAYLFVGESNGDLRWVKRIGTSGSDGKADVQAVYPAPDGTLRLAGKLAGSVVFGPGEAGETTVTAASTSTQDWFVASFAADGSLAWAKVVAGVAIARASLQPDGSYVGFGSVGSDPAVFGKGEKNETTLAAATKFRVRLASDGTLIDATPLGSVPLTALASYAPDGSFTLAGTFQKSITLGAGEANETTLTIDPTFADKYDDLFFARYDAGGQLVWAKQAGSDLDDTVRWLATASDGTLRISGGFVNLITFGPGELDAIKLTGTQFLASYDANGKPLAARSEPLGRAFALRSDDVVLVAGQVGDRRSQVFGEGEPTQTTLKNGTFVANYVSAYGACP